jgi:two-component system LytT family response regulator
MSASKANLYKIVEVKTSKGYKIIDSSSIVFLEANGKFTIIYLDNQSNIITYHMLKWYTNHFLEPNFFRCHNSFVINSSYVNCYDSKEIVMIDGSKVPLSRGKLSALKENLRRFVEG